MAGPVGIVVRVKNDLLSAVFLKSAADAVDRSAEIIKNTALVGAVVFKNTRNIIDFAAVTV